MCHGAGWGWASEMGVDSEFNDQTKYTCRDCAGSGIDLTEPEARELIMDLVYKVDKLQKQIEELESPSSREAATRKAVGRYSAELGKALVAGGVLSAVKDMAEYWNDPSEPRCPARETELIQAVTAAYGRALSHGVLDSIKPPEDHQ